MMTPKDFTPIFTGTILGLALIAWQIWTLNELL